mmetsp:Transcript_107537/g.301161  ORF Transcript_107537/g.301161 Transcript_107537/m.301161 type:complete len:269 (-) Transcript_107537:352-1158(-)
MCQCVRENDGHREHPGDEDLVHAPESAVDVALPVRHHHHAPRVDRCGVHRTLDERRAHNADNAAFETQYHEADLVVRVVGVPITFESTHGQLGALFVGRTVAAHRLPLRPQCRDATANDDRAEQQVAGQHEAASRKHPQVLTPPPQQSVSLSSGVDVSQHPVERTLRGFGAELLSDAWSLTVLALIQRKCANEQHVFLGNRQLQRTDELRSVLAPSMRDHDIDLQRLLHVHEKREAQPGTTGARFDVPFDKVVKTQSRVPTAVLLALG